MSKESYVSVFGNTLIQKAYCNSCKAYTFVLDGITQCCNEEIECQAEKYKIEIPAERKRKGPKKKQMLEIIERQKGRCFYCDYEFSQAFIRKGKIVTLSIVADHKIPYSYSYNNKDNNFVVSCHICNSIKSNKFFATEEEAREYIWGKRNEKGYEAI